MNAPFLVILFSWFAIVRVSCDEIVPSCFRYRRDYEIQSDRFGEFDVQLVVDVASLFASGHLHACSELRFRQFDTGHWLDSFFESQCDVSTPATRIWVTPEFSGSRIIIEMYYGCRHSSGGEAVPILPYGTQIPPNANFYLPALTGLNCQNPWGSASGVNGKYIFVFSGAKGDSFPGTWESHSHTGTGTCGPSPEDYEQSLTGDGFSGAPSAHVHGFEEFTCSGPTVLPIYHEMPFCASRLIDILAGMVIPLIGNDVVTATSSNLEPYSDINGRLLRGGMVLASLGSSLHQHTLSGWTAQALSVGDHATSLQQWVHHDGHDHPIDPTLTSLSNSLPSRNPTVFVQATGRLTADEYSDQFFFFADEMPTKGFKDAAEYAYSYIFGDSVHSDRVPASGGTHTATILPTESDSPRSKIGLGGVSGVSFSIWNHAHIGGVFTTDTIPDLDDLSRIEFQAVTYKDFYHQDGISVYLAEFAYDCGSIYWDDPAVCGGAGVCDGLLGTCTCDPDPVYGLVWYGSDCSTKVTCNSLEFDDPAVCSGLNGTCTLPGTSCTCSSQTYGTWCQSNRTCDGFWWYDTHRVCSGHGTCEGLADDLCTCDSKWDGPFCSVPNCYGYWATQVTEVCSGNGNCVFADECNCTSLWGGPICAEPITCGGKEHTDPLVCRAHGDCLIAGMCTCDYGYSGMECEENECFGLDNTAEAVCNGVGVCWGIGMCSARYYGGGCGECAPDSVVEVFGSVIDTELTFDIPYYTDWSVVPGDEALNETDFFNCTERVVESPEVLGLNSLCHWVRDTQDASRVASLRITVSRSDTTAGIFSSAAARKMTLRLHPITSINFFERIDVALLLRLAAVEKAPLWVVGVVFPVVLVVGLAVVIIAGLTIGVCCYQRKMKKYGQLSVEDIEIMLKEQEAAKDSSHAHFKIDSKAFEIEWSEVKLEKLIGSGGSGASVFLAHFRGFQVAIKIFKTSLLGSSETVFNEFESEVSILSSLAHPYILKFFGASLKHPRVDCSNGDLKDFLEAQQLILEGSYPLPQKIRMLHEISSALSYLHTKGIIHRDIKPDNILVTKSEETRLMDFGLSRVTEHDRKQKQLTQRVGTSLYMAPEVYIGGSYSNACDIFSLSLLIYVVVTEFENPYWVNEVIHFARFRPYLQGIDALKDVEWMAPLLDRMWNHDPESRPTASAVAEALRDHVEGELAEAVSRTRMMSFGMEVSTQPVCAAAGKVTPSRNPLVVTAREKLSSLVVEIFGEGESEAKAELLDSLQTDPLLGKVMSGEGDVFSFAIVCWELLHENFEPYGDMTGVEFRVAQDPMLRPENSATVERDLKEAHLENLVVLMKDCWSHVAKKRPTFAQVVKTISELRSSPEQLSTEPLHQISDVEVVIPINRLRVDDEEEVESADSLVLKNAELMEKVDTLSSEVARLTAEISYLREDRDGEEKKNI